MLLIYHLAKFIKAYFPGLKSLFKRVNTFQMTEAVFGIEEIRQFSNNHIVSKLLS